MENEAFRILAVDDENDILEIIEYNLVANGFEVSTANNGVDAISMMKTFKPHLVLLDIMMPHKNGLQTCKEIRQQDAYEQTIIIFLTALSDEQQEIQGLEMGADDYITKPIKPKLLISRIQSALRRIQIEKSKKIQYQNLEINREKYLIRIDDKSFQLPKKEFELFELLASKPGKVFLRNEILERIWGNEVIVGDRTIDVHIRKIRQKLDIDCISTVKGVGYKFDYEF
ncbi:MAG TPA: response regulator transcription factor [Chitinophagaceae bacterium]|nr:MAG: two component transcriptional regulator, winged helix family [Bacteroidetes bacterium OLB11]HMN32164.1 response regulator transcription factor [Chitinophagaceae bacterium]